MNDGYWHFICITWENGNGSWNVFIDGLLKDSGTRLAKGTTIQGNEYFTSANFLEELIFLYERNDRSS